MFVFFFIWHDFAFIYLTYGNDMNTVIFVFVGPVSRISNEKKFLKLKLLKSYLRSSMLQERLNGLAILCIKKIMLQNIDVDTIIKNFASRNARRQCFL